MLLLQAYTTFRLQDINLLIILLLLAIFGWFCDLCRRIFDTYELSVAVENGQLVRMGNQQTSLDELQTLWDTHMQQDLLRATETPTGAPVFQLSIPWSLTKSSIRMTHDSIELDYDSNLEVLAEMCWGANEGHLMKVVDCYNHPGAMIRSGRSKGALRKKKFGFFGVPYTAVDENEIELLNCCEPGDGRLDDPTSLRDMGRRWSEVMKFEVGRRRRTTIPCHSWRESENQTEGLTAPVEAHGGANMSGFPAALVIRVASINQQITLLDGTREMQGGRRKRVTQQQGGILVHLLDRKRDREPGGEYSETLQVVKSVVFTPSAAYITQEIYGEDESAEEENSCVICLSEPKAITLLPCRHFCVCKNCMERLQRCPVCRSQFTSYLKIEQASSSPSPQDFMEEEQSKPTDLVHGLDEFA
ncbi:hypothetical protein GUITHDRAFT_141433 [Guillardia theta CCMP2712]|uniref:RING-type domain-containing protein n=1 Tax=Guillardia theta (strain CCMP2712) TaxID=905079 RepID=L1J136_GUITC|nr:hypothetical protein GUITHDRAFT_141433 [Guillardia theta CCMP2712]EKX42236.1 hypothetical protein GUITHDRAFT_141433 [Guillardia theta CCMP2712]|eukprot:XP_005829216.1 hypothetical protein GUITHDRAFT_141433 [Guillardia theta CCMP2712]